MSNRRLPWLAVLCFLLVEIALYLALIYAPQEATMGDVQRIFYFHVAAGWVSFLAFFVVFICGIIFLKTGSARWDRLALSSAELGVLFLTMVLLTGPLWAKPVWNTWWSWDARLTTSLVLWLIYVAYLMVRHYASDRERGARFAAVFGIIGFLDVPIVYMSIRWWRTLTGPAPGREFLLNLRLFIGGALLAGIMLALAALYEATTLILFAGA